MATDRRNYYASSFDVAKRDSTLIVLDLKLAAAGRCLELRYGATAPAGGHAQSRFDFSMDLEHVQLFTAWQVLEVWFHAQFVHRSSPYNTVRQIDSS
jgi:hypothetical protein